MRSSMKLPPNGLSSGPANRTGAAQMEVATVNVSRMYFMINAPFEPVFEPDFISKQSLCLLYYKPHGRKKQV